MTKKKQLHDDWEAISGHELNMLDIGDGTVEVTNEKTGRVRKYQLEPVYKQLIRHAYQRGKDNKAPW